MVIPSTGVFVIGPHSLNFNPVEPITSAKQLIEDVMMRQDPQITGELRKPLRTVPRVCALPDKARIPKGHPTYPSATAVETSTAVNLASSINAKLSLLAPDDVVLRRLTPDYSLNVTNLLAFVTYAVIHHYQNLWLSVFLFRFLREGSTSSLHSTLQSWVPDLGEI
jgi:hypothetical protein